ncbi:MAG: adenylyltransferase/cytidyltransferase family protein [Petrotogales bacterium]
MGKGEFDAFTGNTALIIGRFQPLHKGHIELIRTAIEKFGRVQIGIRNTKRDEKNPYSIDTRIEMIKQEFTTEIQKDKLSWVILDDIKAVVRGRKVGWGVYEIRLEEEIEEISATKIRKKK